MMHWRDMRQLRQRSQNFGTASTGSLAGGMQ